jgi:hypothetical protein
MAADARAALRAHSLAAAVTLPVAGLVDAREAVRAAARAPPPGAPPAAWQDVGLAALRLLNVLRAAPQLSTSSVATTKGLRVHVASRWQRELSLPAEGMYRFAYTVSFTNGGPHPVQLATRR